MKTSQNSHLIVFKITEENIKPHNYQYRQELRAK